MKKLISLFVSLVLVIGVYAQINQSNSLKVLDQHLKNYSNVSTGKGIPSISTHDRASLLSEGFEGTAFPPTNWTKTNLDATATYQWKQSATGMHSGSKCAVVKWDGSAGLPQQDEWLISPSLNLTTLTTPILSFWWSMSYGYSVSPYNNYDCRVKVSTNGGTTWTVIWTEDSAGVFTDFVYQKKTIDLTPYATSTNFKIAFQYYGKDGWDLFIDDVYVGDLPNNLIEFTSITDPGMVGVNPPIWSGYTQVPSGQNLPVLFTAALKNNGALTQHNVALTIKELNSGKVQSSSVVASMLKGEIDTSAQIIVDTLNAVGVHKYLLYASSDSITSSYYRDTLTVNVNSNITGLYSRDNNYYDGSGMWNSGTATGLNAFQFANTVEINADPIFAKSISVVLSGSSKVGAPMKALLYRGWGQVKTLIGESDYHTVTANDIATVGNNPKSIELFFQDYSNQKLKLQKDSIYFVAVQAYGGNDTIVLASGSNIPQPDYSVWIFDTDNKWYYYGHPTLVPFIRLNTLTTDPVGIKEIAALDHNLYQNMPNPANNSTIISYDLSKTDNVVVEIYDFMGNKIKSFNQGRQSAGLHSIEVNLSGIASGTYFYTLRTNKNTATKKMVIVK